MFAPCGQGVGYVARNNVFRNNRNNAMVVQCPNSLLEGNFAEGMQNGIVVCSLLQWNEGPAPYNVVLRNNVLKDNYNGIKTEFSMKNREKGRTRPFRHILLDGNVVSNSVIKAVSLEYTDDVVVKGGSGCED